MDGVINYEMVLVEDDIGCLRKGCVVSCHLVRGIGKGIAM